MADGSETACQRKIERTSRERIPRIFPGNEVRVRAAFCGVLQIASARSKPKFFDLYGKSWWAL
jgi:hypothetical protein